MKKSKIILTSIVCGSILLLGCTTNNQPLNIAKSIDHNLTILTNTINHLDTIDNSYLSNPDIYPIAKTVNAPAPSSNHNILAGNDETEKSIGNHKNKICQISLSLNSNIDSYKTNNDTNYENTQDNSTIYYYNIEPIKYMPRYNKNMVENDNYLDGYINKVRNLYAITNDAMEANNTLSNCKTNVLDYCAEIKQLNYSIEDGTFVPNNQQVTALNNYIDDIKVTIKRIKKCNGDLTNEVNTINKNNNGGITTGIDVMNSNYLSVLNHLDIRITYLKNALTTLEQIREILIDAQNIVLQQNNNNIDDTIIQETPNNEINSETKVDNTIDEIQQIDDINNNENKNNIENNQVNNNNEENINSPIIDDKIDSTINKNNSNIDGNESNNNIKDTVLTDNNNITESNESYGNDNINENKENDNISDNGDTIKETTVIEETEENKKKTNIDTYLNTNNNLDTYKKNNNQTDNTIINDNNNITYDDTNLNNNCDNCPPITTLPNELNGNNNLAYGNNLNGTIPLPNDADRINTPNRTFQNGIITQNNLNNGVNNGVNGNYTGMGSSNNYPYVDGDINRTNNNVDTYGYNTMIDMLNRGTVNNGINTLNITEEASSKPAMVNTDSENNIENVDVHIIEDHELEEKNIETVENEEI